MISYEDFDLRIRSGALGIEVRAEHGAQTAREDLVLDLERPMDLQELQLSWDLQERHSGRATAAEAYGRLLFDALIRGRVRDLYQQARGRAAGRQNCGTRIRIVIDPREEGMRAFLRLPWELMADPNADNGAPLALDPARPVVRTLQSFEPAATPPPGPLERVLLAWANPEFTEPLDLASECAHVVKALGSAGLRPSIVEKATRARWLDRIRDERPQIVHFMGHGRFNSILGEGVLVLENAGGGEDELQATTLATAFTGDVSPRLVILNCCLSADPGRTPGAGPFASVAAALVAAGVPAVIAMQTKVRDKNAIRFTERLYARMVAGDPIEAALSEARIALRAGASESLDWAAPVLFVREAASQAEAKREAEPKRAPAPPPPRTPPISQVIQNNGTVENQVIVGNVETFHFGGSEKKK